VLAFLAEIESRPATINDRRSGREELPLAFFDGRKHGARTPRSIRSRVFPGPEHVYGVKAKI
jgi:hypothetical protein